MLLLPTMTHRLAPRIRPGGARRSLGGSLPGRGKRFAAPHRHLLGADRGRGRRRTLFALAASRQPRGRLGGGPAAPRGGRLLLAAGAARAGLRATLLFALGPFTGSLLLGPGGCSLRFLPNPLDLVDVVGDWLVRSHLIHERLAARLRAQFVEVKEEGVLIPSVTPDLEHPLGYEVIEAVVEAILL